MGWTKKINIKRIVRWTIGFALLSFVLAFFLSSCEDKRILKQDREFVAKIKQRLTKIGDSVKVSDLHPGDWEKVCINPISAYTNIEVKNVPGEGFRPNGIELINDPVSTYANDHVWGVYFLYPDHRAEYYRVALKSMNGGAGEGRDKHYCIAKDEAYFIVVKDSRTTLASTKKTTRERDYIHIRLTNKGAKK